MMARKSLALAVLLILAAGVLCACSKSQEEFEQVGEDSIPTLYTVAGEKDIVGTTAGFENGVSYKYVQYGPGVTVDEMQRYVDALEVIGYAQIGSTEVSGSAQKILMGTNSLTQGKKVLVNITLNPDNVTQIDYTVSDGYIDYLPNQESDWSSAEPGETPAESAEEQETAG